jgi:ABC-type branched-subunit amino acid transport system substrate-binding protein
VGVTPTEIKIGVALVDFNAIKNFTDSIRENQDQVYNAFIDDLNAKGGVAGRKLVPVYESFSPIGSAGAVALCTKLTEDDKVFAVMGNFVDFSGDAQQCVTKQHHTPLLTFNLTTAIIDASPPGLVLYPGSTNERVDKILLQLLQQEKTLKGKKVAVLGGTDQAAIVDKTIVPELKKQGVPTGSTAILSAGSSPDTTAAQAQLDSFIERWKGEGVNAVFLSGDIVASQQFVTKLRNEMPKALLMTDTTDVLQMAQALQNQGVKPNPYQGILSASFPTSAYDAGPNWAYCKGIYEKQTGKHAPNGEETIKIAGGKTLDTYGSITDACQLISLFRDVAVRAGKNLNADTWAAAENAYGKIKGGDPGGGPYASLHTGKYDIDDSFALEAYESSIPPAGAWHALTPVRDVTGG